MITGAAADQSLPGLQHDAGREFE